MLQPAVVGATGNVGRRVAAMLASMGYRVRGIARDPSSLEGTGVDVIQADLVDPAQAEKALAGVEAVYLTPPESGEDPLGLETVVTSNVIDAAASAGVQNVVMHTALHADRGNTGARILDNKHALENKLIASGVGYTILRPGWFLQNLFAAKPYIEQGMLSMPWPADLAWAAVSVGDVAQAAVGFLAAGPTNRAFDMHVPGGVTGAQLAAVASRILDRQVTFQAFEGPSDRYVEPFPISSEHKALFAELFDYFRRTLYLGREPEAIRAALPDFRYTSSEEFMTRELFAGQ